MGPSRATITYILYTTTKDTKYKVNPYAQS